jgi:hypothetical protein
MSAKMLKERMRTSYAVTKITVHKKRNPETAVWGCEGDNIDPKPCGDGLNPGKERSLLTDYPQDVCIDN